MRLPKGGPGVDRSGGLAAIPGWITSGEPSVGGFDRACLDALAVDPGDVDRGQDVRDAPDAGPEVRGRPGLVEELDGEFELLDQASADQAGAVPDADERIWRVGVSDHARDLLGGLMGRDHAVADQDGDPGPLAGIDADDRPALAPEQRGRPLDGRSGASGRASTRSTSVGTGVESGIDPGSVMTTAVSGGRSALDSTVLNCRSRSRSSPRSS